MPKFDMVMLDPERLRNARLKRGLTRGEVQRLAGLGESTVWKVHNSRPVTLQTARWIAKALRVSLKSLLAQPGGATGAKQLNKLSRSAGLEKTGSQSAA